MAYAEKIFDLSGEIIGKIETKGYQPRKTVGTITGSMLTAAISQMGSLNALEQTGKRRVWKNVVGDELPSADTFSRTYSHLELNGLRAGLKYVYQRLKRTKAIKTRRGFKVAIITFWLTIMIAFNIVHAFFRFNLKPVVRERRTFLNITDEIKAGIYIDWERPP